MYLLVHEDVATPKQGSKHLEIRIRDIVNLERGYEDNAADGMF